VYPVAYFKGRGGIFGSRGGDNFGGPINVLGKGGLQCSPKRGLFAVAICMITSIHPDILTQ